MTLEEIKDNYAKELGYQYWDKLRETLLLCNHWNKYDEHNDHINLITQKKALENAAENAKASSKAEYRTDEWGMNSTLVTSSQVIKTTITSEDNLIK